MVVENQDLVGRKAVFLKKVLLTCPEVGEEFQGAVLWDVAHRHRLELADEDGRDGDTLAGERLREDRFRADAVGVDVGDDRHRLRFIDDIRRSLQIVLEAHLHSSASWNVNKAWGCGEGEGLGRSAKWRTGAGVA